MEVTKTRNILEIFKYVSLEMKVKLKIIHWWKNGKEGNFYLKRTKGNSLAIQWLGVRTFTAEGLAGELSCMAQPKKKKTDLRASNPEH